MVYPAAGLINYYRGKRLVLINKDATPRDSMADLVINGKIGEVLEKRSGSRKTGGDKDVSAIGNKI